MPKYTIKIENVTNPQSVKTVDTFAVECGEKEIRAVAANMAVLVSEAKAPKQKPKP